jgi:DNA repair protein RadC
MHEGHRSRLRELYFEQGLDAMQDHQVLELLLTFSIPRKDTNEIAHTLLERYGTLDKVFKADLLDLRDVSGIGENSAALIRLFGDVARRIGMRKQAEKLRTGSEIARYCLTLLSMQKYEVMYLISLDKGRSILHADKISSGTLNETVIYPRIAVECALRHHAYCVLLTHNHPSGNITPSRDDIVTTRSIKEALEPIGIGLLDHIITGKDRAYSMIGASELTPFDPAPETIAAEAP